MLKNQRQRQFIQRLNLYRSFINFFLDIQKNFNTWRYVYELNQIVNLLTLNKKNNNYYLNLPLNNQKTRSKKPHINVLKWKLLAYQFTSKIVCLKKVKLSRNFILFDYVNRLWYKQWYSEWLKIRHKRFYVKQTSKNKKSNINFPILQYKHVIRNFKTINKKKQKFLTHFNLGFLFLEYMIEKDKRKRFNRKILKKKYSKYFLIKPRVQRYTTARRI